MVFTLVILTIVSIFTVALLTNLSAYVRNASFENTKSLVHLDAQNLLQLSVAFLRPSFRGVTGIVLTWTTRRVSEDISWWGTFKNMLLNQSDGDFWRNFFQRVDENRYFDLSSNQNFNERLSLHGLSGSTIVLPITGTYMVGQNPYSVLVVSRVVRNKIEAYSLAVLAIDFLNKYAYFTEKETRPGGQRIYFITQDVIDGPMRSNDVINIWGNPTFRSTVEIKGYRVESGNPNFMMGWHRLTDQDIQDYNMTKIKQNYSSDIEVLVKPMRDFLVGPETGIKLNLKGKTIRVGNNNRTAEKLVVEFKSAQGQGSDHFMKVYVRYRQGQVTGTDALFTLKPTDGGSGFRIVIHGENARKWLDLDESTPDEKNVNFNGILMSDLTIALQNLSNSDKPVYVDGKYTIYSKENVEIYDHVVYEDFRHLFPHNTIDNIVVNDELIQQMKSATRTDFLNIVSDKFVLVKEKRRGQSTYKQNNLKITGSIYAFDESFTVENYNTGSPAGQLTIFGSLMQYYRGPVGTFSGGTIRTGYYKNYIYDERILEGISSIGTPAKRDGLIPLTIRGIY